MSSAITQLSCFSSITNNRRLRFQTRSYRCPTNFRPGKVLNVMSSDEHDTKVSNSKSNITPSYIEDTPASDNGNSIKSHSIAEGFVVESSANGYKQDEVVSHPKRAAKIHDFCFGIPFGGLVLTGGLLGFIFSRNPVTLGTGVLFGGALLALSTISLKVWRQGKSSLPFILGQAVLSLALVWKNFQSYSLSHKLFPTGFNVVISAAMLCFYCYVVLSGGNPPPKKKASVAIENS